MPRWMTRFIGLVVIGSAGSPLFAHEEILVRLDGSGDYTEIKPALGSAREGDWLVLGPGEHVITEPMRPAYRSLRIRSEAGAEGTAIRMMPRDPANGSLVVLPRERSVELIGLTLTGGTGQGNPTSRGGAIYSPQDGTVRLESCVIAGNSATQGGGIYSGGGGRDG